jgi:hypothetical protein
MKKVIIHAVNLVDTSPTKFKGNFYTSANNHLKNSTHSFEIGETCIINKAYMGGTKLSDNIFYMFHYILIGIGTPFWPIYLLVNSRMETEGTTIWTANTGEEWKNPFAHV